MKTVWIDPKTGCIGILEKWRHAQFFGVGHFDIGWKSGPIMRMAPNWVYVGRL